jgi:predicted TIM-barrel fold metal-dependent hydrolase
MDYRMISADDHLDLQYLPRDLWTSRLPAAFRDRAPHVEEKNGAALWVCEGQTWGRCAGAPVPRRPKPNPTAFDRVGIDESERRPARPQLRLADMDRDGVEAQVIYGPITSVSIADPELRVACHRAYNDWLADFCAAAPQRLLGVAMLPPEDPAAAADEVVRIARAGRLRQANLQIAWVKPRLHDPVWEPLWRAFEETGLILSFHVVVFGGGGSQLGVSAPEAGKPASTFAATKLFMGQFLDPFVDLFAWGILERHPKLRLVMSEAGVGWLPWIVQELDQRFARLYEAKDYWAGRGGIPLTTRPSELFRRQVWASFQVDPVALTLLDFYGEGRLLWASDYPHPDGTWPRSREAIDAQMAALAPAVRRQLTRENAAALYGL